MSRTWTSAFLLLLCVPACSSDPDEVAPPGSPTEDPNTIAYSVETQVASGAEVQLCKFITMPVDRGDLAVNRVNHSYTAGSHHFLVFRTSMTEMPAGGEDLVPCDQTEWMSSVRGVAYGAQTTDGDNTMPEGVSQRFTAGEILLVQTHYVNTTAQALDARIDFAFHTLPAEQAPIEAGLLFFFNPVINVPPNGSASAELSCPLPADVTLLFASSHMHKRGVGFEAQQEGGARGSLYTTDAWSDPLPRSFSGEPEAAIAAGSAITYRCDFQNDRAETVMVGPRADEDEMCMFIGMYYPRLDDDTERCMRGAAVTKGTLSCFDTIGCARDCAEGDTTCRAGCIEQVCPTAAIPMTQFLQCFGPACGETCQAAGSESPECSECVTSKCLTQAAACNAATCAAP